ncbi:natural resistance-associated macrophage protein [Tilletiaria anomala UBC 951]|uniref:Natural resistance-associated macrophage protein n=1 Tax=Tilletiaria anomala (strain ATCC 24038 / CBS 436.72 / UBC 951) TaxID=1037660 RepID=A0A066VWA3_TILAU|nr:natural resistance-associated macrophage protein [Tilletiaria anomala UBC 951]KDN43094.1 natural resistance-associated macrophage protein [Tilletiaria anomala UBC 951]
MQKTGRLLKRHWVFVGPGMISVVAYCDPGNWQSNLSAGASSGYKLLFAILLSSIFAIILQVLCVRLGIVTGMDLAQASRKLILGEPFGNRQRGDRDADRFSQAAVTGAEVGASVGTGTDTHATAISNPAGWNGLQTRRQKAIWCTRRIVLWTLYAISELAIVATELAELVGSAIALNLLFPGLPLWGGVLVTSVDVFLILLIYQPEKGTRIFEALIATLVGIVLISFIILVIRVKPVWTDVFDGYVPSATLVQPANLYLAVAILGATVMPHALFLGSHFSTLNRMAYFHSKGSPDHAMLPDTSAWELCASFVRLPAPPPMAKLRQRIPVVHRLSLDLIRIHLPHATVDIILSLFCFALVINSLILIVAGAAFYHGQRAGSGAAGTGADSDIGDLFDAFNLLQAYVGRGSAVLFAIALLASAQSASITVTLSGQIISEGFIQWRISPFMRRLITRLLAMIPSLAVASAVGRGGLDQMLVASQVALSMALPFVTLPLLVLTGLKRVMKVNEVAASHVPTPSASTSAFESQGRADFQSQSQSYQIPSLSLHRYAEEGNKDTILDGGAPSAFASNGDDQLRQQRQQGFQAQELQNQHNAHGHVERTGLCTVASPLTAAAVGAAPLSSTSVAPISPPKRYAYFHNGWVIRTLAWAVFGVICIADVYVLSTSF